MAKYLWFITTTLLLISFLKNKDKTVNAIKKSFLQFLNILPLFLFVMAVYAVLITCIPTQIIHKYVGIDSGIKGIAASLGIGSISVMPGFAAYPLCAALKTQGVPFYIIAAFSLSLMNVGIVTFPLEKKFLGLKVALIRNALALIICIIGVIIIKLVFGE